MSEKNERGKKRSKAYYKKCAHGGKRRCIGANVLEPGIRGFLVMCNHNEKNAVRESYNLLNEYADSIFGDKPSINVQNSNQTQTENRSSDEDSSDDDDVEKAMKKEIEGMQSVDSSQKRFQNVSTKAKNCVFIRTTLENPVEIVTVLMNDIASKKLNKARFAARILPIIGTCKANTSDIAKLAADTLKPVFSSNEHTVPKSYTILFKSRNNNGTSCGREGVVSSLIKVVKDINPCVKFSWSDFSVAILVEIVCNVCCLGVAPDFIRLRKYNLQQLTKGVKTEDTAEGGEEKKESSDKCQIEIESGVCKDEDENKGDTVTENLETPVNVTVSSVSATNNETENDDESDKNSTNCLPERKIEVADEKNKEAKETVCA